MKKTIFNDNLWGLSSFNEIGYDKEHQLLTIYYYSGEVLEFQNVKEKDVFELIISTDKEELINQTFKTTFPYKIVDNLSIL
ncbi:KTSC domain-containing protein [Salirhabdus sp. Marseille-P4669]|uniref:KTSC domain-containing protein n=1 Tax=Salirhabdus sp. Marseille-P4669 TaxID=2042310 RepID=UPI000C7E5D48|nr:KTSC domain-containing protein [Salirhabdus sp. Marseille-P4669]